MSVLLVGMFFIRVGDSFGDNPRNVLEDALEGFHQVGARRSLDLNKYSSMQPARRNQLQ